MMRKSMLKAGLALLFAGIVVGLPTSLAAQTTNKAAADKKPAIEKKDTAAKKPSAHPFHGKLAAVDKFAKTITVGKSVYQITSETKIKKSGKPAMLEDGMVGEEVTGYVKPTDEGKLVAATVNFGPKAEAKSAEKKKEKTEKK